MAAGFRVRGPLHDVLVVALGETRYTEGKAARAKASRHRGPRWMRPVLTEAGVRRDTVRMLRAVAAASRDGDGLLVAAAERLPEFKHPVLVVWASEDRVMPPSHGQRLAALVPAGRLIEVADSYTLIPLDQPARLAEVIREFTQR
jgi:pimeloyl-ACP methyl ester carboxylesterase